LFGVNVEEILSRRLTWWMEVGLEVLVVSFDLILKEGKKFLGFPLGEGFCLG